MTPLQTLESWERPRRRAPLVLLAVGLAIAGASIAVALVHAARHAESAPGEGDGPAAAVSPTPDGSAGEEPAAAPNATATVAPAATPDGAAAPFPALSDAEVADLLARARTLEAQGKPWDARELLLPALPSVPPARAAEIEAMLGRLADAIYLVPRPAPGKTEMVVLPGDSLSAIAARHVCPVAFIMKANGITDPSRIRPGQRLVFPDKPKFEVRVSKSSNTLLLTLDGKFYKRYVCGTGRDARTPVGTFEIKDRIEHPEWWTDGGKVVPYGDPENILGTHWLALEATGDTPRVTGYGIHGTWDDASLGRQSSAGCVRLRNADVEELFTLLPRKTPVIIED